MQILYLDEHFAAVNKPSGIAVHRGWADDETFVMTELKRQLDTWVYPVHRLDRGASGVLLFALSKGAARELCRRFELGAVEKHYRALVRGAPPDHVVIDHPLRRDDSRTGAAQTAVTEVRRLEQFGRYAWVDARPRTGRLHQIRRHLKHISCPIIGDVRYGKGEHNRLFRERHALHRLALHAWMLVTTKLDSDEVLTIQAPIPSDLDGALGQLRAKVALEAGPGLGTADDPEQRT